MADRRRLSESEVATALELLPRWSGDGTELRREIECRSFTAAAELVCELAPIADDLDHHPDIDIRWRTITFRLSTHSAGGVTRMDVDLARRIDELA